MGGSEKSSSHQRSRHRTRSKSRDKERERSRDRHRDRGHRDHSSRDKDRDRDRGYDRDYYSHRRLSRSKSKRSKHSKKSRYRRRSSTSSSSDSSSSSRDSRSSRNSRSSKYYSSRKSKTRAPSSENSSRSALTVSTPTASISKGIDLLDFEVQKALDTIEEDTFEPKSFFSTKDREAPELPTNSEKVIIDLNAETVTFPKPIEIATEMPAKEEIFHPNFIGDPDQKQEKWIRKLLMYRLKFMTE